MLRLDDIKKVAWWALCLLMLLFYAPVHAQLSPTDEHLHSLLSRARKCWKSSPDSAAIYLHLATKTARADGSSHALGWLNATLGDYYSLPTLNRKGKDEVAKTDSMLRSKAFEHYLKAYEHLSTTAINDSICWQVLTNIVNMAQEQGYSNELNGYLSALVEYAKRLGYKKEGESLLLAIKLNTARKAFNEAIAIAAKALELYVVNSDSLGVSHTYYNIAYVHYGLRNYDMVKYYISKGLEYFGRNIEVTLDSDALAPYVLYSLYNMRSVVSIFTNEYDSALVYSKQTMSLCQSVGDTTHLIDVLNNLGYVYAILGRYSDAIKKYQESLKMDKAFNGIPEDEESEKTLNVRNNKAIAYIKWGRFFEASQEMELVKSNIGKIKRVEQLHEAFDILSEIACAQHDYKSAYEYLKIKSVYADSIYNKSRNIAVLGGQIQLDIKIKKLEADNMEYAYRVAQNEAAKHRQMLIIVVLIFLLISIVIALVFWSYRQKRQAIESENEKLIELKNEIQHINVELAKSNATKDRLFATISHDLRNPCMALLNMSSDLSADLPIEQQKQSIDAIAKGVKQLYGLINNLLQWSYSQINNADALPDNIDITDIIEQEIQYVSLMANKKQIRIANAAKTAIFAYANSQQVGIIIRNLLTNAIKFTPTGGFIDVKVREHSEKVEIVICDTGDGFKDFGFTEPIPLDLLISTRGTNNEVGSGMGLRICKDMAEKNGGQMWAQNRPGGGACFYIMLPSAQK